MAKRQGKDQMQQLFSTGYGESYTQKPIAPYEVVQIDGHIIDLLTTVETEDADGQPITSTATRIWLIAVIDVCTRCIIGYSVSPHFNYNQYDVLEAIKNSIKPHDHKPFELKSLEYPDTGGFPSEVIPESQWACFNTIMLDNAKSHMAKHVVNKLTEQLKCCMNFGSVATPETRGIVERFFGTLERSGFHRLPNTTGSNPRDPKRKEPEKAALKYKVRFEDVCEILEYLIATYNNSAHGSLRNYSPLQEMEQRMRNGYMPCYIVPDEKRDMVEKLTNFTEECTLRGGYETGKQLRINYEGAAYHALKLRIPDSMVGEKVYIEVDPSDVSRVKMFRNDGTYFCDMIAEGEFGTTPHSLKTRRMALKLKNERKDPENMFNPHLTNLANELKERGKKNRRSRTKADTIIREAKGALDRKGPAEIIDISTVNETISNGKPLRKVVGESSRKQEELSPDEINAIFAKYPGDNFSAVMEINRLTKKG